MAYNDKSAERIRKHLKRRKGYAEKKMFGGICFLIDGNMACGITQNDLMVRVGPDAWDACIQEPHARAMDFTGKIMRGFVTVDSKGFETDDDLKAWLERGVKYARSLPAK